MEDWKTRWEKFKEKAIIGYWIDEDDEHQEEYNTYLSEFDTTKIEDFISQELDRVEKRAREEGVKDGMRGMIDILCEKGCGSMFAVIEEKDVNKKIEELSKLTTK